MRVVLILHSLQRQTKTKRSRTSLLEMPEEASNASCPGIGAGSITQFAVGNSSNCAVGQQIASGHYLGGLRIYGAPFYGVCDAEVYKQDGRAS